MFDGQVVGPGDLVASVKVGPHLVRGSILDAAERSAGTGRPAVRVAAFRPVGLAVLVKEHVTGAARERFEASVRSKAAGLGATLRSIDYVRDEVPAVEAAMRAVTRGPRRADIVLTAGGASTDPRDAFYVAVRALRGRIVRHGVPSHPGLDAVARPCGPEQLSSACRAAARSRRRPPRTCSCRGCVAGQPATAATVAKLGHGGILTRSQRFRFPAYARDLDAPDG